MTILGIETSCDETSAAVVRSSAAVRGLPRTRQPTGRSPRGYFEILSNVISSQIELHRPYGGVIPELASRQHLALIESVIQQALAKAKVSLRKMDAVAATYGPGLASSLLVGLTTAKAIAVSINKPFIAVNHLEGHLWSPFLDSRSHACPPWRASTLARRGGLRRSHVALIASGGHTLLVCVNARGRLRLLGQTLDDAAGEAFDKVAKLLGLGYPGGPIIDRLARKGNADAIQFPRGLLNRDDFNFSFSGLKTAVLYHVRNIQRSTPIAHSPKLKAQIPNICASFQEAVVDVLVQKSLRAARETHSSLITVSGGVACNTRLREKFQQALRHSDTQALFASPCFCTDNATMIAAAAFAKLPRASAKDLRRDAEPSAALVS